MAKSTPPLVHPQLCLLRYGNIFNTLRSPPSPPSSPNLILVLGCSSCIPVVTKVGLQSLHPTGYPGSHLGGLTHFPGGSETKKSACNERDPGSIPGSGRYTGGEWLLTPVFSPGESHGERILVGYSCKDSQRVRHG